MTAMSSKLPLVRFVIFDNSLLNGRPLSTQNGSSEKQDLNYFSDINYSKLAIISLVQEKSLFKNLLFS